MMAFYHMCDEASSVVTDVHARTMMDWGAQSTDRQCAMSSGLDSPFSCSGVKREADIVL